MRCLGSREEGILEYIFMHRLSLLEYSNKNGRYKLEILAIEMKFGGNLPGPFLQQD